MTRVAVCKWSKDAEIIPINDGSSSQEAVARDAEMVRNNKMMMISSRKTVNGIIIEDSLIVNDTSNSQEIATAAAAVQYHGRSEFCEMKGDIRIDGNSSTAFIVSSETDILTAENTHEKPWWIAKFKTLFEALSRYEIIDIDDRHDVHCFHSLTIGLKGRNNKELKAIRTQLLIIPRKRSRSFTNVGEIAQTGRKLELPEWASRASFEDPAKDMNIRYLDYKIKVEESTLIQQYPADHEVLRDPSAIGKQGWVAFRSIYLDKQNVTLDVERFRPTLVKL
uniref:Uncharacterized protein n=1 Tax=Salix viminalis TaxID=40686 RepID=A0A6N2KEB6_SALVM